MQAKKKRLTLDMDPAFQRRLEGHCGAEGRQHEAVLS